MLKFTAYGNFAVKSQHLQTEKRNIMKQKVFLLDTNVLIHDPESIFNFEKSIVGIPLIVLEELDTFKSENNDKGVAARAVIRSLDALRSRGSLKEGVTLDNGATFKVLFPSEQTNALSPFKMNIADNEILKTALCLQEEGYQVQFISKDINARVKSDVLGIHAQDYFKDNVSKNNFHKGWHVAAVSSIQLKKDFPEELHEFLNEKKLVVNEFVQLESKNNPFNYKLFRYLGGDKFKAVEHPPLHWAIKPRNPQQLMALHLLLDPDIKLVSLVGAAGTGKTFLALVAGLAQILHQDLYHKMLISRPVVPLGKDIGYLPGTIEEKLHNWMLPIYDNMDFIAHATRVENHVKEALVDNDYVDYKAGKHKKHNKHKKEKRNMFGLPTLDQLIQAGSISLEAITYMRGRSIPFQYILIDEVQNLTPHEVKTLISRVGEGSKIILAGDPFQIDSPYLDFSSNGLMVASNKFKGNAVFGSVFLEYSERSELSKLVNELL